VSDHLSKLRKLVKRRGESENTPSIHGKKGKKKPKKGGKKHG